MSSVTIKIDVTKLKMLRMAGGPKATRKALSKLAYFCEAEMKRSMEGQKSGNTYGTHQASAPGEAPAVDTGNLKNSIQAEPVNDGSRQWRVLVGAPYGLALEFGTADMAPRPFARPAAEATAKQAETVFREAFREL